MFERMEKLKTLILKQNIHSFFLGPISQGFPTFWSRSDFSEAVSGRKLISKYSYKTVLKFINIYFKKEV